MNKLAILVFLIVVVSGCQSEVVSSAEKEITLLEKEMENAPGLDKAEALVEKYKGYVAANPGDTVANPRYLYRAAALQYRMNRFSVAVELLKTAIKDYYTAPNTLNSALLLGSIYDEKLRNTESKHTVYQALLQAFPIRNLVDTIQTKIPEGAPGLQARLDTLRLNMFDANSGKIEYRVANDYINSCELHAMLLPNSPKSPELLFKAGETSRFIRAFNKALELYAWIQGRYPDHEKTPQALFLSAFTLDNDLKRYEEAKAMYDKFLQDYPNDEFADDTQFLLKNLGKSDEEIINSFN